MLAKGGGAIVSYASDAAKAPTPGESVHGGALAANVMFTKVLALELGRQNIRVNAITPSITRGARTYDAVMAGGFSKKLFEKAERKARLGAASAETVAPMAVFLVSPLASHITGQVISVNGGISVA
jgi:NAD(P)-dependent dehydrogenase (short-subunit alcohol dehydrogenase family)